MPIDINKKNYDNPEAVEEICRCPTRAADGTITIAYVVRTMIRVGEIHHTSAPTFVLNKAMSFIGPRYFNK